MQSLPLFADRARRGAGTSSSKRHAVALVPGIAFAAAVGALALAAGPWPALASHGVGPLPLALVLGLLPGQWPPVRRAQALAGGLAFSKQRLLRTGVALYGLRGSPAPASTIQGAEARRQVPPRSHPDHQAV